MDNIVSSLRQRMEGEIVLQDILRERAILSPHATAVCFLSYPGGTESAERLSYRDLDRAAGAIAYRLLQYVAPGERVLLAHEPGLNFVETFFGCLYAGLAPVPLAQTHLRDPERMAKIAANCDSRLLLLTAARTEQAAKMYGSSLLVLNSESLLDTDVYHFQEPERGDLSPLAFLQYTSGSTGDPKGVIVRQRGLLANIAQISAACGFGPGDVGVSWLPHYHDMGLISMLLTPIYCGFPAVLMSPLSFLQYPERWLRAIGTYRGTYCGGPNLTFRHCLERVPEDMRGSFDLSSWRIAFCGAEPIHARTLKQFADAFEPSGFHSARFSPCYGLAEATVFVTATPPGLGADTTDFDAEALEYGFARPAQIDAESNCLVGCGFPHPDTEIHVVNEAGEDLPQGGIGEIWVSGPGLASGYWGNEEATRETFAATLPNVPEKHFLRTGDLGFLYKDQLFISGRSKDLIIVNGRNIAPQELEWEAHACHSAVRQAAAFAISHNGTEQAAMVVEVQRGLQVADLDMVITAIRRSVAMTHDVPLAAVALVHPGLVPRTTSGKVMRNQCRRTYLEEGFASLRHWRSAAPPLSNGKAIPETPWIMRRSIHRQPARRIFCFPYAGGGATAFVNWAQRLGESVEVCPVQLPGRETRLNEEPIRHIEPVLKFFETIAEAQNGIPYTFFGYCLGADIAFSVAHHLRDRGLQGPRAMTFAARQAPSVRPDIAHLYQFDDQDLLETLSQVRTIAPELLNNPFWLRQTLRLVRADCEFSEGLKMPEGPPLDCPVTVFGGLSDPWIAEEELRAWRNHTTGKFSLRMVEGTHVFLDEQRNAILEQITQDFGLRHVENPGNRLSISIADTSRQGALQC
jgi:acyl-CoA synthetase (AMP-forming)/AMP-acid ligase II/surfactin synthase thioesterase subunit